MKFTKGTEAIIIALIYLVGLYIWTLPIQKDKMPYGEFDAISHWELGDYMAQADLPIVTLPAYIDRRYGRDNAFKPHTLWYHPPYHTNFAVAQVLGGDRIVPIYLLNAMLSSFLVLALYFFMRKMFGFLPALLSSVLAAFSARDIFVFLWGQWPERISYYMIPLVLYAYYKYTDSYLSGQTKQIYIYLTGILLGITIFLHPMGFFYSSTVLVVYSLFLLARKRRIFFNWKHLTIATIFFILLLSLFPYQTGSVVVQFFGKKEGIDTSANDFSRLFSWFKKPNKDLGVPDFYFSFRQMHGLWTLPFLLLGIAFALWKRRDKDYVLLAWLIGLYIVLHMDVIGKGPFVHRTLSASSHIFIPFTVLGAVYISSFTSNHHYKIYIKYAIAVLVIILAVSVNGKFAFSTLKDAYSGLGRMNTAQYDAAEWMRQNLPQDANVTDIGVINLQRAYWIQGVSLHMQTPFAPKTENFPTEEEMAQYIMIDYSDLLRMGRRDIAEQILAWERDAMANDTIVYNKDDVRVYKNEE